MLPKHSRKAVHPIVHLHQELAIFGTRLAQICGAEGVNHALTKFYKTFLASYIPDAKILVEHVCRGAICQLTKRNRALRERG